MRITRLRLHDFKRHANFELKPAFGLTVIRGPNEAGKTTIQRALELALFRRVSSADAEMREMTRWGAGEQVAPEVELEFEADGEGGHLTKSFRGSKGTVRLALGKRQTSDPATADAWLADLTGIPNEKFFRSTASVSHHEVMRLDRDEATLRDRLQQSISGATRGISLARKRLDEAIKGLKAAGAKNPGPIRRAEDERARLADALQKGEEALARLERDREAHVAALTRRQAADAARAEARERLAQAELGVKLETERARADELYHKYAQAAEIRAERSRLEQRHPSQIALPMLRDRVDQLRALEITIAECTATLAVEEPQIDWNVPAPAWRPFFRAGLALVVAGLVVLGLQAWSRLLNFDVPIVGTEQATIVVSLLAVGGAAVLFIAYRRRDAGADLVVAHQLRHEAIERRLRGRSDTEERLREAEARRERIFDELAQATTAAAEKLLAAEEEHTHGLEVLQARYAELMRGETVSDVEKARDQSAAEAARKTAALAGMGDLGRDPLGGRERCSARLRTVEAEREAALREEVAAQGRVEQNPVDALEVDATAEALAQATDRLAALLRRQRVYELTLATLDAAEQRTMKKATTFLEERMAGDIERITGGRYGKVQVTDDLGISLWSAERGDWVPIAALSQGTIDQVYLAARIELVRLVTQDRRPPLVFDDPFVTYDDGRAARALELLRDLAADHQILYLTTSDRYDSVAEKVVELSAPGERPRKAKS